MSRTSLSQIHQFIEGYSSGKFWIGIDIHKRSYSLALLREDGMSYTWVTTADPIRLVEQLQGLPITISSIVYESGPTGFGLARTLKKANIPDTLTLMIRDFVPESPWLCTAVLKTVISIHQVIIIPFIKRAPGYV